MRASGTHGTRRYAAGHAQRMGLRSRSDAKMRAAATHPTRSGPREAETRGAGPPARDAPANLRAGQTAHHFQLPMTNSTQPALKDRGTDVAMDEIDQPESVRRDSVVAYAWIECMDRGFGTHMSSRRTRRSGARSNGLSDGIPYANLEPCSRTASNCKVEPIGSAPLRSCAAQVP